MVEHILAALAGYQIDNCEVWVNAAEMPALDGSSQAALEALMQAGAVEQDATREVYVVDQEVRVGSQDAWLVVGAHESTRIDARATNWISVPSHRSAGNDWKCN